MKKENIKVGMLLKVKRKEKCAELGWDLEENWFNPDFCGQKVEVVSEVSNTDWGKSTYYDSIDVKYGSLTQTIPIHLIKKIKED